MENFNMVQQAASGGTDWVTIILWIVGIIAVWFIFVYPYWRVFASQMAGKADLQLAQNEQQIQVAKAQSRLNAADLNKQAAIIEAEAVAKQIETIGSNLKEHGLYLRWQWIKMMEERPDSSVIYVPTETNLPILEASRFQANKPKQEEEF